MRYFVGILLSEFDSFFQQSDADAAPKKKKESTTDFFHLEGFESHFSWLSQLFPAAGEAVPADETSYTNFRGGLGHLAANSSMEIHRRGKHLGRISSNTSAKSCRKLGVFRGAVSDSLSEGEAPRRLFQSTSVQCYSIFPSGPGCCPVEDAH